MVKHSTTRIAGWLLMFNGLGHLVPAFYGSRMTWYAIGSAGFWNQMIPPWTTDNLLLQRDFWATLGSFAMPLFILGYLVVWVAGQGKSVPRSIGWALLVYALVASVIAPVGGFWITCLPAVVLIVQPRPALTS